MKFLILIACLAMAGCAAAFPATDGPFVFQRVIEIPGMPKNAIFKRSQKWMVQTFKTKDVIEYQNKAEGVIIGNGVIPRPQSPINILGAGSILFDVREDVEDGKAKLSFENFVITVPPSNDPSSGPTTGGEYPLTLQEDWYRTQQPLTELTESLRAYLLFTQPIE